MARYTKKDADGRYYIESVNGKLESDKFGHTYGEAINRFAELENADVAPRAEVIEEYRKKVYAKMEKYTVFGREYIQRIMREVEKEYTEGQK